MIFKLWHNSVSFGHEIYDGPNDLPDGPGQRDFKLAVLTTSQGKGVVVNGVGVPVPLPKRDWTLRLTSPMMHLDDVRAVVEYAATIPEDRMLLGVLPELQASG